MMITPLARARACALVVLTVIWMAFAGCASSAATAGAGGTALVRVMSYNIHAGKDAGGNPNLERVAALIDSLRADVVLLQEVDRGTERSGRVDQLAELQRLTGMHGAFGKSLDFQGGEYGIALLARWPIREWRGYPLRVEPPQERSGGSYEPRSALRVAIDAPGGPLTVINTHLDPTGIGTFRRQELVGLMAIAEREVAGNARLLIGGDLNTRPSSDEIAALGLALEDSWVACRAAGDGGTYPASAPDRRIDYIFFRAGGCREAVVVPSQASDHRPLFVVLEMR